MIKANFNAYNNYITDSIYQWDINRDLTVSGLNLNIEYGCPEVHFSNRNTDRAIVRQATWASRILTVRIPNSLLQEPFTIYAHIGVYEGEAFKVVEKVEIPVIPKERPSDYQIQDTDEEIYSFKALENSLSNRATVSQVNKVEARISNIIANASSTEGNTELIDIRMDAEGNIHSTAGDAIRNQIVSANKRNHNATIFVNKPPVLSFVKNESIELTLTGNSHIFFNSKVYNVSERTVKTTDITNQALFVVLYNIVSDELRIQYYTAPLHDNDVIIGTAYEDRLFLNYIGKNTYATSLMPDSIIPVMPYTWSDKPLKMSCTENTDNWTLSLTMESALYVIEGLASYMISARTVTVTTEAKNYLYKVLYDPVNDSIRFLYHGKKHLDREIILAIYHPTWGLHTNGREYHDRACNISLTPLIMGSADKFVEIDTVKGTITFPNDTLLLTNRAGKTAYYGLFENLDNLIATYDTSGTSAIIVYFDLNTEKVGTCKYSDRLDSNKLALASIRTSTGAVSILAPYKVNGKPYNLDADSLGFSEATYYNVKGVNHRGYNTEAPENTLSAFVLSKARGFKYVECDVAFTSDNVGVILHDTTIDRTSNGTGAINSKTLAEVKALDFGSWFSSDYAGETIPTFEEFISLCRKIGLYPYIELKAGSEAEIKSLIDTVKRYGMLRNVTWISFYSNVLDYVNKYDNKARIGFICDTLSETNVNTAVSLRNGTNEVFIDAGSSSVTSETVTSCIDNDLPLEVWTVNDKASMVALDPYISGITSDNLNASQVLYELSNRVKK